MYAGSGVADTVSWRCLRGRINLAVVGDGTRVLGVDIDGCAPPGRRRALPVQRANAKLAGAEEPLSSCVQHLQFQAAYVRYVRQ